MDYSFFPTYYLFLNVLPITPFILPIILIILFTVPIIKIQLFYKAHPPTKGEKTTTLVAIHNEDTKLRNDEQNNGQFNLIFQG